MRAAIELGRAMPNFSLDPAISSSLSGEAIAAVTAPCKSGNVILKF